MANLHSRRTSAAKTPAQDDAEGPALAATASQLLDVAERLFAENGIDSVSLRQIVQASGQSNASAAHYHFGTRESLLIALVERRVRHINAVRHKRLDKLEAAGREASVHAIVTAAVGVLGDVVKTEPWGPDYVRVAAHALFSPQMHLRELIDPQVLSSQARLAGMLRRLLPALPPRVLDDRIAMAGNEAIYSIARWVHANGPVTPANARSYGALLRNTTDFLAGGMVAPVGDPDA